MTPHSEIVSGLNGRRPNRGSQRLREIPYSEIRLAKLVLDNTGQQIDPSLIGKYKRAQARPNYTRRKILEKWPGIPPDFWDMPPADDGASA